MSQKVSLLDVFEGKRFQKTVLAVSIFAFLVLELLIYLASAGQAGEKSRVVITDANGAKVYETQGSALTSYEKLYFENTFGPLANHRIHLETEAAPFPFRAWVSAAVGIPVGLTMLVSFLVRVYLLLLYGEDKEKKEEAPQESSQNDRFGSLFNSFHNISVFHIGFFVIIGVLIFWIVPNFLQDFAKVIMVAMREYKMFFLGSAIFLALLITWIIYLRYKLSKQMLENQLDLEKFRVEKQLLVQSEPPQLLPHPMNEVQEP